MKILLVVVTLLLSSISYSQEEDGNALYQKEDVSKATKGWSLSATTGYITIPTPSFGNNVWGSVNLGYSKKNWNVTLWGGSNYWIEGRQPDVRLGLSTSYTFLKW